MSAREAALPHLLDGGPDKVLWGVSLRGKVVELAQHERRPDQAAEAHASRPRKPEPTDASGLLALQRTLGNAAVLRALELSGHPYAQPSVQRKDQAQEQHVHGAGCGHQQAAADQAAVQRSAVRDVLSGSGRPMDAPLREEMEARLGADFSDVRIHDNSAARASAADIGARAYTSGSNVVLGEGGTDKHTLAHELTHVIQQRRGPVAGTDNGSGLSISDPSDRFEREAEANATRVMSGAPSALRHDAPGNSSTEAAGAVQRAVRVGPAGPNAVLHETMEGFEASLTDRQATFLGSVPWLRDTVAGLVGGGGGVEYNFADEMDVVRWAAFRTYAERLNAALSGNAPEGATNEYTADLRRKMAALNNEKNRFQTAGNQTPAGVHNEVPDQGGQYTLFGQTYRIVQQRTAAGANYQGHYYAFKNGHVIQYQGRLTGTAAQNILNALIDPEQDPNGMPVGGGVTVAQVDEFVCSFLAEPSRWPTEQIFNLIASEYSGGAGITGDVRGAVPMASGSTWEPLAAVIGRETPTRAISFIDSTPPLKEHLAKALSSKKAMASPEAFVTFMRRQADIRD